MNDARHRTPSQVCAVLFPALFLVLAHCGAIQGDEVSLTDLEATEEFTRTSFEPILRKRRRNVV